MSECLPNSNNKLASMCSLNKQLLLQKLKVFVLSVFQMQICASNSLNSLSHFPYHLCTFTLDLWQIIKKI